MQDRIFYSVCFGFTIGVLLRSFVSVNFYFVLLLMLISLAGVFYFILVKYKWGIITGIFVLMFSLGILRFHMADKPAPYVFESQLGQKVSFSGEIVDELDIKENNQKLTILLAPQGLALDSLRAKPFPAIKILVTTNFGEDFKYGDEVNLSGKLEKPENFVTDQGKEFDYINYLRKNGIFYIVNYGEVEVVSRGHGNWIKSILFSVKEKFLEKMNFPIRSPENLLMGGLILGEKSSFSQELR